MNRNLENELRVALNRSKAPDGFVERVMSRVPQRASRWQRVEKWAAMAAALVVVVGGLEYRHTQQERERQAQQAQRQLMLALSITNETLDHVEAHLRVSAGTIRIPEYHK